jgi:hypothetical protein
MYELPHDDPSLRSRRFDADRPSGTELTLGNVQKLASAAAELRVETTDINERLAKYRAAFDATIADLNQRIAVVEATTKTAIAEAAQRDARRGPRP